MALLHSFARLGYVGIGFHHIGHLKGIEIANQIARGDGMIFVDYAEGQTFGQPFVHEGGEEIVTEQRSYDHAKPINGLHGKSAEFA